MSQQRIALAWKNLTHSLPRLMLASCGIAFAVVLMFMQNGFRNALFDSTVKIVEDTETHLVIFSRARFSLSATPRFSFDYISQARQVPGVANASPLYLENVFSILRKPGCVSRPIRVIGMDLNGGHLRLPKNETYRNRLHAPDTAIIDGRSKRAFQIDVDAIRRGTEQEAELAGKKLSLVGVFQMGTDFANEGNLVMSVENFCKYFSYRNFGRPRERVDLGLVLCDANTDLRELKARLTRQLPNDVTVMTKGEYMAREIDFWSKSTPIGIIFGIGTLMGFIVGVIICYQVIFNDINDHMPEFATLKAMGYRASYFMQVVITESVYLSLFGFIPGMLISLALFQLITAQTGLLMYLTFGRAFMVLVLTILMCVVSGCAAMRKLISADPASLF